MFTKEFAEEFLQLLAKHTSTSIEHISFEIQEEYKFLLISIDVGRIGDRNEVERILRSGQAFARETLPSAERAFTWMINAKIESEVVNSVFGGDAASPECGFLMS